MTKEEILDKHGRLISGPALAAMEEYAKQQAIEFHKWTLLKQYELVWDVSGNQLYNDAANNWFEPEDIYDQFMIEQSIK